MKPSVEPLRHDQAPWPPAARRVLLLVVALLTLTGLLACDESEDGPERDAAEVGPTDVVSDVAPDTFADPIPDTVLDPDDTVDDFGHVDAPEDPVPDVIDDPRDGDIDGAVEVDADSSGASEPDETNDDEDLSVGPDLFDPTLGCVWDQGSGSDYPRCPCPGVRLGELCCNGGDENVYECDSDGRWSYVHDAFCAMHSSISDCPPSRCPQGEIPFPCECEQEVDEFCCDPDGDDGTIYVCGVDNWWGRWDAVSCEDRPDAPPCPTAE